MKDSAGQRRAGDVADGFGRNVMTASASGSRGYNAAVDLVDRHIAAGRGAKAAFVDQTLTLTYAGLAAQTNRMANLLDTYQIPRESRIGVLMHDCVEWPVAFLGAIKAGVVPVAFNTLLTTEQYAYMLEDCRAKALFVSAALLNQVQPILARLPHLKYVFVVGGEAPAYALSLASELAHHSDQYKAADTSPDEPAFWLYSSGSTGNPKGTKHVHSSLMETANTYAAQVLGMREDDVIFSAAKFFFAYGLGNSLTFPLSVGATAVLLSGRPTPESVFGMLKQHQPTIFFGVPTLYSAMLAYPAGGKENGSAKLRLCASAGEALPEEIGRAWMAKFGVDLLDGIGSTEMLHIFLSNRPGDIKLGSTGKAVPGYTLRLVDDTGHDVADGEVGELLIKGASAAEGYWNQRAKSQATFEGSWCRSGDKYIRDAGGYYTYQGRTDDMFKVSGIWVSPFEVESALVSHPDILEAAVIAHDDGDGLAKPKAFVVLKDGHKASPALVAALQEHVKAKAGPWKYPRWIEIMDTLPKTATGKIQRFKLRS
jgi:4-hydroxybenzoate-CoA ligase